MSTITESALRMARHPATRSVARCVAACALGAIQTALRPRSGEQPGQMRSPLAAK
ncbi:MULTISPECIES: hypothetical protein [Nocardia]|uniref:hypothetical protein n=1 Tax=Nocardia TaxID=1817 RepID=UPI0002F53637|nr:MULTISPECIES: hypothetical protein [Nocardia]